MIEKRNSNYFFFLIYNTLEVSITNSFIYYDTNQTITHSFSKEFNVIVADDDGGTTPPVDPNPPIVPNPPTEPDKPTESDTPNKPTDNKDMMLSIDTIKSISSINENNYKTILDINEKFKNWSKEEQNYFLNELQKNNIDFNNLVIQSNNYANKENSSSTSNYNLVLYITIPIAIVLIAVIIVAVVLIRKRNKKSNIIRKK
ncbi:hypothetical protein [Malacoplasma muris]|uniref:hypothetical protein n=1 Tax=Malacoplasma muris TaxID=2119 RepID=UPI00398E66A3